MSIAADVREQLSGLYRDESAGTEAAKRFQAATARLADHAEELEARVAELEREAEQRR